MIKCFNCDNINDKNDNYCCKCGIRLESSCTNCGKALNNNALFCSNCGKSIDNDGLKKEFFIRQNLENLFEKACENKDMNQWLKRKKEICSPLAQSEIFFELKEVMDSFNGINPDIIVRESQFLNWEVVSVGSSQNIIINSICFDRLDRQELIFVLVTCYALFELDVARYLTAKNYFIDNPEKRKKVSIDDVEFKKFGEQLDVLYYSAQKKAIDLTDNIKGALFSIIKHSKGSKHFDAHIDIFDEIDQKTDINRVDILAGRNLDKLALLVEDDFTIFSRIKKLYSYSNTAEHFINVQNRRTHPYFNISADAIRTMKHISLDPAGNLIINCASRANVIIDRQGRFFLDFGKPVDIFKYSSRAQIQQPDEIEPAIEEETEVKVRPAIEEETEVKVRPAIEEETEVKVIPAIEEETEVKVIPAIEIADEIEVDEISYDISEDYLEDDDLEDNGIEDSKDTLPWEESEISFAEKDEPIADEISSPYQEFDLDSVLDIPLKENINSNKEVNNLNEGITKLYDEDIQDIGTFGDLDSFNLDEFNDQTSHIDSSDTKPLNSVTNIFESDESQSSPLQNDTLDLDDLDLGDYGMDDFLSDDSNDLKVETVIPEDDPIEDETIEDETIEDETIEDETIADETIADETIADEITADEITADEIIDEDTFAEEILDQEESIPIFDDKVIEWSKDGNNQVDQQNINYGIFVVDTGNNRIQSFDMDGNHIRSFGRKGLGPGEFDSPKKIFIQKDGSLFISDFTNSRIQKMDTFGNHILSFGNPGTNPGEFNYPMGIVTDQEKRIYIVDAWNNRIQVFDNNGVFIRCFGEYGDSEGQFNSPNSITIGEDQFLYITDSGNNRVQVFNLNGNFQTMFGELGSGKDCCEFDTPSGISVDMNNNIYVADTGNNRIQVFNEPGKPSFSFGEWGDEPGNLDAPNGISLDSAGNIYVSDTWNHRVQIFNPRGEYISHFGSHGSSDSYFIYASDVQVFEK